MKYTVNLVKILRKEEKKAGDRRTRLLAFSLACLGVLVLSLFYCTLEVLTMKRVIDSERQSLARIQSEYRKYQETKMTVDKADIELLNGIQTARIYWTRKLASMAFHLPDNYWITTFGYKEKTFTVQGYGYITPQQEQLITLDDYLNNLRADSTYNDVFSLTFLGSTARTDEHVRERVSFEFSSLNGKAAAQ